MLCLIILLFLVWFLGFNKSKKTVASSKKQIFGFDSNVWKVTSSEGVKQKKQVSNKVLPPNCIWRSEVLGTYRKQKKNAI
jgi:hypothetical protein